MSSPHLLAVGGAHIDRRGRVSGTYVPGTSNPGTLSEEVGGVVFNALRNAVQRGVTASLLSVRGGDNAGEAVGRAIAEVGIADLSAVFLDRTTPSYTALLDPDGELIAGLADMGLYELALPKQVRRAKLREAVASADAVLCDANMPVSALETLLSVSEGRPVFAIAISPAKATRLAGLLPALSCLFMNGHEARALCAPKTPATVAEFASELGAKGLKRGVITAGGGPVTGFDEAGTFQITPPPARRIADVTGAGDALAGGTIAALMKGADLRAALREGMAAALLTVEAHAAVADLSGEAFAEALELVPEVNGEW
ncbi:carbohydrate kinase family protein [Mesorhizobium sp. 1B3]|uniref:carbohydrate kinase family protein n=1 Tax=Mesorhizobium sp. 1B3 TaxID=3243599 RepID=UPI003D98BF73